MTRKDYPMLASALRRARPRDYLTNTIARNAWYNAVTEISLELAHDNPAFDATRFFDDCGVPS